MHHQGLQVTPQRFSIIEDKSTCSYTVELPTAASCPDLGSFVLLHFLSRSIMWHQLTSDGDPSQEELAWLWPCSFRWCYLLRSTASGAVSTTGVDTVRGGCAASRVLSFHDVLMPVLHTRDQTPQHSRIACHTKHFGWAFRDFFR